MGVKLVNLDAGDKLQAIAPVISEDKETDLASWTTELARRPGYCFVPTSFGAVWAAWFSCLRRFGRS